MVPNTPDVFAIPTPALQFIGLFITFFFSSLALVAFVIRVWSRLKVTRTWGLDDWLMVPAELCSVLMCGPFYMCKLNARSSRRVIYTNRHQARLLRMATRGRPCRLRPLARPLVVLHRANLLQSNPRASKMLRPRLHPAARREKTGHSDSRIRSHWFHCASSCCDLLRCGPSMLPHTGSVGSS